MIKILVCATGQFAVSIIDKLVEWDAYEIVGVVTQPDKPMGREQIVTPGPATDGDGYFEIWIDEFQFVKVPEIYRIGFEIG